MAANDLDLDDIDRTDSALRAWSAQQEEDATAPPPLARSGDGRSYRVHGIDDRGVVGRAMTSRSSTRARVGSADE